MKTFSIEELYKHELENIWSQANNDIEIFSRGYAVQNEVIENSIMFVGMNPSFRKDLSSISHFYNNVQYGEIYRYFVKFQEISKELDLPWSHIDLLFIRETDQRNVKDLMNSKNPGIKNFLEMQLDFSRKVIKQAKPKIIVVANAYARENFGFKTHFDNEIGTHRISEDSDLKDTPIFFTSMLTGQRALDKGSYDRLIWHLKKINEN